MTFYYNFHGDGPRLIISNLFINTEFPERDTWREHSVTHVKVGESETLKRIKVQSLT